MNSAQIKDNASLPSSTSLHKNPKNADLICSKPQTHNSYTENSISSANNHLAATSAAISGSQIGSMVLNKNYSPIFNNTYVSHQQPQESHHS
jgi:hypothetical protein